MMPGVVNRSTSTCQRSAARPTSSASSRCDRQQVVLAVHVEQSGRRLDQPVAYRMPVLPDQRDPFVVVEGDHPDRAGMLDVLPGDQLPVGRADLVLDKAGDLARGQRGRTCSTGQDIGCRAICGPEMTIMRGSSSRRPPGSRVASRRSRAASISPTNSGCGRVGRDFSSGWAWVATK